MTDKIAPLAIGNQTAYLQYLGIFHSNWSAIDVHTDYAIYQFLKVTPEQAHLITSGMMFGRKARLLVDLIGHSGDPRRAKLLGAFNKIRAAKRDIISHAYVASDANTLTFLERNTSGAFKVKEHVFTLKQFHAHAVDVHIATVAFIAALEVSHEQLNDFVKAAFNLEKSDNTSPDKPLTRR